MCCDKVTFLHSSNAQWTGPTYLRLPTDVYVIGPGFNACTNHLIAIETILKETRQITQVIHVMGPWARHHAFRSIMIK